VHVDLLVLPGRLVLPAAVLECPDELLLLVSIEITGWPASVN